MQMRCKLPNEFAIRKPRLSCPAVPANFMNGPAWGMGGPPARPHISLRCARPRHAAPHVAAPWPAASRSAASDGARAAAGQNPATPPASDASGRRHAPGGPAGALSAGALPPGFGMGSRSSRE